MNRVDALFKRLRREKRCGLIAYVTCGDPDIEIARSSTPRPGER